MEAPERKPSINPQIPPSSTFKELRLKPKPKPTKELNKATNNRIQWSQFFESLDCRVLNTFSFEDPGSDHVTKQTKVSAQSVVSLKDFWLLHDFNLQ